MPALKEHEDAYGQMMWDYYQGKDVPEIIEREDGHIGLSGGGKNYMAEFTDWPERQREAIALAAGRTLDLGCGCGRVSLHLQELGHEVVGIDNSPLAVRVCRDRGVTDARAMSVTDVSRKALGAFQTIVAFGNNWGLLGNPHRGRWLLRRFAGMVPAGGLFLAESRKVHSTTDPIHLAYQAANRKRGRLPGQIRIRVRYGRTIGPWFDYMMVSPTEMRKVIAGTGWGLERELADEHSPMWVACLRREG